MTVKSNLQEEKRAYKLEEMLNSLVIREVQNKNNCIEFIR